MLRHTLILLIFSAFSSVGFAQPGDLNNLKDIHLNDYPTFPRDVDSNGLANNFKAIALGEITIDSSADLSIIPFLRKEKYLNLRITLSTIPTQFYQFRNTENLRLTLENDSIDISFLNEFRNVKILQMEISGVLYSTGDLMLDSLDHLFIAGEKVASLEAFEKISSLQTIILVTPMLISFPAFDMENHIQHVSVAQRQFVECEDCPVNSHKINLANLSRLQELESLYLSHINGLTQIPTNLSRNLKVLTITGRVRYSPKFEILCHLDDLKPLLVYPQLETIEITDIHLKKMTGNYSKLPLQRVKIEVFGLTDMSGLASFPTGTDGGRTFKCEQLPEIDQTFCKLFWNRKFEKPWCEACEFWH